MQKMTGRHTQELERLRRDSHDNCSECGKPFLLGDTSHSGYNKKGKPLYVGDCCSHLLSETAVRNVYSPRPFIKPPENSVLWRYMDIAKFISLIKDNALFFARADRLGDPFEGAKGLLRRKDNWDKYYLEFFREAILNPPPGHKCTLDEIQIEQESKRLLSDLEKGGKMQLHTTFLSCWHENESESEALWRIYGGNDGMAIAIKTTYARLNKALGDDPSIEIGRVKYVDFSKEFAGVNESFFRKRKAFQHENEIRALVHVFENPPEYGLPMPVAIKTLLEFVYVSPLASKWFTKVIQEITNRFGLVVPILRSELEEAPFF